MNQSKKELIEFLVDDFKKTTPKHKQQDVFRISYMLQQLNEDELVVLKNEAEKQQKDVL